VTARQGGTRRTDSGDAGREVFISLTERSASLTVSGEIFRDDPGSTLDCDCSPMRATPIFRRLGLGHLCFHDTGCTGKEIEY
jgi:hypothetical protein